MLKTVLALVATMMLAAPANARSSPQPIPFAKDKPYRHAYSQLVLPARLNGFERDTLTTFVPETPDLNMMADYRSADQGEVITIYVFRPTNGATAIWFDQARGGIELRSNLYGTIVPVPGPTSFTPPGRGNAAGFVVAYGTALHFKSTALAMVPLGEWTVKIRYSSKTLEAGALRARIEQVVGELGWPAKLDPAPDAVPTQPCAEPIQFNDQAKDAPENMAAAMLNGMMLMIASKRGQPTDKDKLVVWCRDPGPALPGRLYRPGGAKDQYLVSLGDAGISITVTPDDPLPGNAKDAPPAPSWGVHLNDIDHIVTFRSQDGLPNLERVNTVLAGPPVTKVPSFGDDTTVTVNTGPAK